MNRQESNRNLKDEQNVAGVSICESFVIICEALLPSSEDCDCEVV